MNPARERQRRVLEAPAPRAKRQRAAAAAQTEQRAALTQDRITAERASNTAAKVQLRMEKAEEHLNFKR